MKVADLHPNDIGLATFEDVGDVANLRTSAKKIVDAINEVYQNGSPASSFGTQLYVDGENNIILGENNIVYGSNNLIIGSDNVVVANNINIVGSNKHVDNCPAELYTDSFDITTGKLRLSFPGEPPFSIDDKVLLSISMSWVTPDWSDYRTIETGKQIVEIEEYNAEEKTLLFKNFEYDSNPPDAEHTVFDYISTITFVVLNDTFLLNMQNNSNSLLMGNSALGQRSCSVNAGYAAGQYSFAANNARCNGNYSTALGSTTASGSYSFTANKGTTYAEGAVGLNYGYSYAPYSLALGYYARTYGRAIKCLSMDNAAKQLTAASGQDLSNLAGKTIHIRCYNKINGVLFKSATVSSVNGTTITLTDATFSTNDYAEHLFPDGYVFICDTSTSYSQGNLAGGCYGIAASKHSFGHGMHVVAAHESSAIFGTYGVTDAAGSLVLANGTSLKEPGLAFKVLSDGSVHADGEYTTPCADYAEFFEWADGNPSGEDRAGYFVKLQGDKIVKCSAFDTPLGIVSAAPAFIGDSGELHWHDKFLTDDFGRIQYHDITVPAEVDEDGNVVVEEHMERQPIINPEWDSATEYIPRKDRKEWSPVGVLGKLVVYDSGNLTSGDLCRCGENGIAEKSINNGYPVLKRISEDKVLIWFKG